MSNWTEYLASQGARCTLDAAPQVTDFGRTLTSTELAAGFVATILDQGLIAASGEDAARFLHSQLTNDVEHLPTDAARLAGFCTPKGRLQATFLMWRDADAIWLQLPRAIQAPLQKRLSMFVMRAKATLRDATEEAPVGAVLGLGGAAAEAALRAAGWTLPAAPYGVVHGELGTLIRLADAFGAPRYQWLCSPDTAIAALPALRSQLVLAGNDAWNLSAIHAAVPQVGIATQEQFVPQMINYELLGGVNFKKGCYPGQEIVARSQYLGKLKRRTALASVAAEAVQAGTEVFASDDPDQPCGMVVNAAPNGAGGTDLLVEVKLAALEQSVHVGSAAGPQLGWLAMPYPLDALDL